MPHAIRIDEHGGPETMCWLETERRTPGPGEALVRHTAIGVNYIDVYHRTGLYPMTLPGGLGLEAAGRVEAVGDEDSGLTPGDRVGYVAGPPGAYATHAVVATERLLRLPDDIDERTAAAVLLKGLTAHYLLFRTFPVRSGHRVLVTAAAGGVGSLLCRWAQAQGATVIGCAGGEDKAEHARRNGCSEVIRYDQEPIAERVQALTDGQGVDVVYDSVGAATFTASLDSLTRLGMMVSFGNASGPVPAFEPAELASRGSLFFTRPSLFHYIATREELTAAAQTLFDALGAGILEAHIGQTWPLAEAAEAHRALEARQTVGSTLLLPDT